MENTEQIPGKYTEKQKKNKKQKMHKTSQTKKTPNNIGAKQMNTRIEKKENAQKEYTKGKMEKIE